MDRTLYKHYFTSERSADWTCPTCGKAVLRIMKDSFRHAEGRRSRESHTHDDWDPDWIRYVYSCLLQCTNDQCKEIVASSGKGCVDLDVVDSGNGELEQTYADFFKPLFFEPPLILIKFPTVCPESVTQPLKDSFRLFFASPSAAANGVRIALEALLTELGVRRFIVKGKRRRFLPLHSRINLLPSKYSEFRDLLLAIKWLGNAGSHSGEVTPDDVMDAYELIEHVLDEVYARKGKALKALAKRVNKKRGSAR